MPKQIHDRATTCSKCGGPVIHVRDPFTGATFPVEGFAFEGVTLDPPGPGERNPRVSGRAQVHVPHLPGCEPQEGEEEEEADGGE